LTYRFDCTEHRFVLGYDKLAIELEDMSLIEMNAYLLSRSPTIARDVADANTTGYWGHGSPRATDTEGSVSTGLKAAKVPCKMMWYPADRHPLSSVDAYADSYDGAIEGSCIPLNKRALYQGYLKHLF
jgi:hypothetical protein